VFNGLADERQLIGAIPLYDPLREDSKTTIAAAKEMGFDVKMIAGDQLAIGKEIASQLVRRNYILDAAAFGDTRHHKFSQRHLSFNDLCRD
jgi:H+-transporting ATPase